MSKQKSFAGAKLVNNKFFNIMQNIPGSSIIYKNFDDTILWVNDNTKKNINLPSMIGKKGVDFFSKETVEYCLAHDAEVISLPSTDNQIVTKKIKLILQSGLQLENIVMKKIWFDKNQKKPKGIIINALDINKINLRTHARELDSRDKLQKLQYNLYFNLINPLKELLLLNNIMQETIQNNAHALLFCQETKDQIRQLLASCNHAINTQLGLDEHEIQNTFFMESMNLNIFLLNFINKFNRHLENNNLHISLQLLNNIPNELRIDQGRLYKILCALVEHLIKVANNSFLCKINLIFKVGIKTQTNKNKHIFFILEGPSHLFSNFNNIYQSQQMLLIRNFIMQLNCYLELINKNKISYIYINIPI